MITYQNHRETAIFPLARDIVRHAGEPVAVVAGINRCIAEETLDLIVGEHKGVAGDEEIVRPGILQFAVATPGGGHSGFHRQARHQQHQIGG